MKSIGNIFCAADPPGKRAGRNRTLSLTPEERAALSRALLRPKKTLTPAEVNNRIIHGDFTRVAKFLPGNFVDLLILDPPYNLEKDFNGRKFSAVGDREYLDYLRSWFPLLPRLLKPEATVYLCGDWRCSAAEYQVLTEYFTVRNRIVWQREKGRGARTNWKNCAEDIWYATVSSRFHFDVDAVKQLRRVRAPYRENGVPRDWQEGKEGRFRLTCPSNFWDDISVPFWSMPENTDHPTQKPEKLLAKLILASSPPGAMVFDPFLGSGSTAAAARKIGRRFCGILIYYEYWCWESERLFCAGSDHRIQGYEGGVFRERNSPPPGGRQKIAGSVPEAPKG